jgi:alkaline phosphatase D
MLAASSLLLAARDSGAIPAEAPFPYGVASGDPTHSSIVLWTGLSAQEQRSVRVRWWLRRTRDGRQIREGVAEANADQGYTIKVKVDGLAPDERYEYAFEHGGAMSAVGRTRTLPVAGKRPLRLAVFSCSRYSSGWFHAYRHAAQDETIDFALHIGDYIYEVPSGATATTTGRFEVPDRELLTLPEYSARYALHKRDPDSQALHAALPLMAIWDDHEFADDASRHGESTHLSEHWPQRLDAARRAYFQWMPLMPGKGQRLWRQCRIGDLADIYLLDTRIEGRDAQMDPRDQRFASADRHMLGREQEHWLAQAIANPRQPLWTVVVSSVVLSPLAWPNELRDHIDVKRSAPLRRLLESRIARSEAGLAGNTDAWDGYPAAQHRLLNMLRTRAGKTVVLSGDTHSSWSFALHGNDGNPLGWEVGVPSVTSEASLECVTLTQGELEAMFRTRNPRLSYLNPGARGYTVLELREESAFAEWRYVSSVVEPDAQWRVGHRLDMPLL